MLAIYPGPPGRVRMAAQPRASGSSVSGRRAVRTPAWRAGARTRWQSVISPGPWTLRAIPLIWGGDTNIGQVADVLTSLWPHDENVAASW